MQPVNFIGIFFFQTLFLLTAISPVNGQGKGVLPSVKVTDLEGKSVDASTIFDKGKPVILSFWATWCRPCVQELNAVFENLPDWTEKTGVRLIAVSIDDSRSSARVAPFVKGRGWDFPVVLDLNGDFKRIMDVVNVPHTFLLDGNGKVAWQHTTYAPGDEAELLKQIKMLVLR